MKRSVLFFLAALLISINVVRAEDPADAYVDVYGLIQQGDSLNTAGKGQEALAKYRQAQTALNKFHKDHPEFQPKTVEYRANYLTQKIQQLSTAAPAPPTQPGSSGQPQTAGQSPSKTASAVSVKLISPGNEPKTPLRLHPKPGDKQTTTVTINTKTEVALAGNKMPETPSPAISITSETTAKSVSPEGDISYETVTTDAPAVPQLKGMSATGTLTSRGINKSIDVKMPSGLTPQLAQVADQIKEGYATAAQPLPEEPVGLGAKWEVKIPTKSGGISMLQTLTCELASLEGDKAVVKINYVQTAPNQKVQNPAMPTVKMDLTHFNGSGSGESMLDLSKALPTQSTTDGQLDMTMTTGAGAQKQEITVKLTLNVTTDSK
jgi:hypothetical protein